MTETTNIDISTKPYEANQIESKILDFWFSNDFFKLAIDNLKPNYSIVIPPPNITGQLHMGHALNGTIQDMLVRYKRMLGYNVLWQPGVDHAGISTQMVVERKLKSQGLSRHDLGRSKFLEEVWQWRHQYGNQIVNQYKCIGVSFAFERLAFTMDENYVKAIYRAFVKLYKDNYIYRGHRVSNWCPSCMTSLSDLEVEHKETNGFLYSLKYFLVDDNNNKTSEYLTIATTRPETIFADLAVAVNPNDERYKALIGKSVIIPLTDKTIRIIADEYVDQNFGTGVLKVTPAHDTNDFEIGLRHNLGLISIIDESGILMESIDVPSKYQRIDRFKARQIIETDLSANDFMLGKENYKIPLGFCERCQTAIEPLLSKQWYVKMQDLAKLAIECVENNDITFHPDRYKLTYLDWLNSIKDWCVSRQLWWGHRIPIYTCSDCNYEDAHEDNVEKCPKCNSVNYEQDQDVLDTWFSSSLWPFATLGWLDEPQIFNKFYPTDVLSTAREIINLWVARMIFMSKYLTGKIPFKDVLIHPVIQTSDGKRMSKSKGNAIDPIDMINKYGCDANRFWFASIGIKGDQDVRFREDKLEEYKRFNNKIWNASKFILNSISRFTITNIDIDKLSLADKFILHEYNKLVENVRKAFENYDFDNITKEFYDFFWNIFCDWYIEIAKIEISTNAINVINVLYYVLEGCLRLIHPVMPFITEELWQVLPDSIYKENEPSIMFATYPSYNSQFIFESENSRFNFIIKIIKAIRNIRQTFNVPSSLKPDIIFIINDSDSIDLIKSNLSIIESLAKVKIEFASDLSSKPSLSAIEEVNNLKIILPLAKLIDTDKSKIKLEQQKSALLKELTKNTEILNKGDFRQKAPKEKVESIENKINELNVQINNLNNHLSIFL